MFDGANDYVDCGNSASLQLTSKVTVEAWVYVENVTGNKTIASKLVHAGDKEGYSLELADDKPAFLLGRNWGDWSGVTAAVGITANQWYHIAGTYDGSSIKIYINGIERGSQAYANGIVDSGTSLFIGARHGPGWPFKGLIDEVRVWNNDRTAEQILANMHRQLLGNEAGLMAYYKLDTGTGTVAYDASPNGNNGTLTNGPTWHTSNAMSGDGSFVHYDFAGTLTDKYKNSLLTAFGVENDGFNRNNATSGFGTDDNGTYWTWTSTLARGGGFWIDIDQNISTSYTIGMRFSLSQTGSSYKKIIDYQNSTSDKGFYFLGGKLNFYPVGTGNAQVSDGQIVELFVSRHTDGTFKAYLVVDGVVQLPPELNVNAGANAIPDIVGGKPRFGFFFDDKATASEAANGGKVYEISVWSGPISYVTYNANNALSGSAPGVQVKPYGAAIALRENTGNLARTGYTFLGWNTKADGTGTDYATGGQYVGDDSITLYAKWTANSYAVTFDKQEGIGGSDGVGATYDAAMPTATAPTRSGYAFGGYYTETSGGGTQYYTAAMTSVKNWDLASNTTLYAKWIAIIASGPTATPNPAVVGQTVTFTVTTTDAVGDTLSYAWNFADGSTGTSATISHTYATAGNYTVSVEISDGKGGTATGTVVVTVNASGGGGGGDIPWDPIDDNGNGIPNKIEDTLGTDQNLPPVTGPTNDLDLIRFRFRPQSTAIKEPRIRFKAAVVVPADFTIDNNRIVLYCNEVAAILPLSTSHRSSGFWRAEPEAGVGNAAEGSKVWVRLKKNRKSDDQTLLLRGILTGPMVKDAMFGNTIYLACNSKGYQISLIPDVKKSEK
jgi:uncharacterized repeat protein (TIGR02543 family)